MRKYVVKEIFYSIQGEGARSGTANIFIRFAGCNLQCNYVKNGFDCDTDFKNGRAMSLDEIMGEICSLTMRCKNIILTGGEPGVQVDNELVAYFKDFGYFLAIETNGMYKLPEGIDWICVSPKIRKSYGWDMSVIMQRYANEVKFVCVPSDGIPQIEDMITTYKYISPAHDGETLHPGALNYCIDLVKENPSWCLSVQQHKGWKVR